MTKVITLILLTGTAYTGMAGGAVGWVAWPTEATDYYYAYDDASQAPFTYPELPEMPQAPYENYAIHDDPDAVMLNPYNDRTNKYYLPDSFWFFGNWYRPGLDLFISPDGWLSFDDPPDEGYPTPPAIIPPFPVADAPNELMAVLWEDYNLTTAAPPSDSNRIYLLYDSTSQILTVEWYKVQHSQNQHQYSFLAFLQMGGQELLMGEGGGLFYSGHLIHFMYNFASAGWDADGAVTGIEDYFGEAGIFYQGVIDTEDDDLHVIRMGYQKTFIHNITAIAILKPDTLVATQVPVEPRIVAANTGRESDVADAQVDIFDKDEQGVYTYHYTALHMNSGDYDTLFADPWTPGDIGETYTVRFWVNSDADQSSYSDTIYKEVRVIEGGIEELPGKAGFTFDICQLEKRSLRLEFSVPYRTNVNITLYDAGGRYIDNLIDIPIDPGTHTITWDGCDDRGHEIAKGVYLVCMEACGWSNVKKITLVK
ncbi:hypothetical protein JXM67_04250 [candidate division WOR-3 bacterium]|nr:hypothetical protein [candidate division WOR-3 bacterium]